MISGAFACLTSRGKTPLIKVPIVLACFSSTSIPFEREKRKASPDNLTIRRGVAPIKHQFMRFLMFFLRVTRFFTVTLTKLPKLVCLNVLFFLFE